jgi:hypothetical protein
MSSFNALLKDLSVKPLEEGSVQRLRVRTSAATACAGTVLPSICLTSPGSRTFPRTASGPALGEELENKELFDLSGFWEIYELNRDNVLDRLERRHYVNFDCSNGIEFIT